jgi:hypothetical protein
MKKKFFKIICEINSVSRKYFFCLPVFVFSLSVFAQPAPPTDSILPGVIVLKRPTLSALFISKISYSYPKMWQKKRPWESRVKTYQRGYKSWLSDPSAPRPFDTQVKIDSSGVQGDSIRADYVGDKSNQPTIFDWTKFTEPIVHHFQWNDTIRLDSAQFQYSIDKDGNAVCTLLPWSKTDSSSILLEKEAFPIMNTLKLWYPAQHISNRTSKLENISCTVVVTIYGFAADGEPPPVIVMESTPRK